MVTFIGCGIFREEYAFLPDALKRRMEPLFLDSMLHMDPAALDGRLERLLEDGKNAAAVLAYGDCSPHLLDFGGRARIGRTRGVNCCEIWLGSARYKELRREGVFFLMPEWARRWREVLQEGLGLTDAALARDFFGQSMRRAVYIDTGAAEPPYAALDEFSDYAGLDVSVERTGPEHFIAAVAAALAETDNG